jgi:methanogenic corrinoid protein MtbC1
MGKAEENLELIARIAQLDEDATLAIVGERLAASDDPLNIIEACSQGIREVGERYARREYYVSGLIMGGEIFREVMEMVEPLLEETRTGQLAGRVLLGTVQGDIHDLGKNLVNVLLRCHGFAVHDLRVDVAPADFVTATRELQPDIVGLSGLVTVSHESMRETVTLLRSLKNEGWQVPPIMIGGGMIDEHVCRYVEADYWVTDAMSGVHLCQRLMEERRTTPTA